MLSIHKLGQKHNIERNVSRLYIKKWCDEFFGKEEYEKELQKLEERQEVDKVDF